MRIGVNKQASFECILDTIVYKDDDSVWDAQYIVTREAM